MTNPTSQPGPYRVDLTSQDLRTGTIRLPRQLHDHFEPGSVNASQPGGNMTVELQHVAPSELHGLREFFDEHQLRTNDALLIHLEGTSIRLEPFYRNRRRSEVRPSRPAPEDIEPTADDTAPRQEALPQARDTAHPDEHDLQPPAGQAADPAPDEQADHSDSEHTPEPDAQPTDAAGVVWAEPSEDAFDDFSAFDDLGELDPLDFELDEGAGKFTADEPPENPPAPEQTPAHAHHAAPRRNFPLSPQGPIHTPVETPPTEASAAADTVPAQQMEMSVPAETGDSKEQVRRHLNEPGLPSILQESVMAASLDIPPEQMSQILAELSREPESRLGTIRPGYWLLKRESQE